MESENDKSGLSYASGNLCIKLSGASKCAEDPCNVVVKVIPEPDVKVQWR